MPVLTCRRVTFYSIGDELSFSSWLDQVKVIRRWEGKSDAILLHVPSRISNTGLRELLALFHRYHIDMTQLACFQSSTNQTWFNDQKAYWHKRVFKDRAATKRKA
jgi:hypothetical protein